MKKNKVVCIRFRNSEYMKCYLNISERDAIQKFIKEETISETQYKHMDDNIQIDTIEFDDNFTLWYP